MINWAKWEKRLQHLEILRESEEMEIIISLVDENRKVVERYLVGPNGEHIPLPLEEDENPEETLPVPTTSAQEAPAETQKTSERIVNPLSDKQDAEPKKIAPVRDKPDLFPLPPKRTFRSWMD